MNKSFWEQRAKDYNKLNWVNDRYFMDKIIDFSSFQPSDLVLEVGTGTGLVARAVAPLVRKVIAVDSSSHMLSLSPGDKINIEWVEGDARDLVFRNDLFDRVIARYVFHHILYGADRAMQECYRVLKRNGSMVFAEGVPPSERTRQNFIDIFKLKEERITFMLEDMLSLMTNAGFIVTRGETITLKQMSIRNWVESSGLPQSTQETLFLMHCNAPDYFKRDYNMTETSNDCLIDMKVAIIVGTKY